MKAGTVLALLLMSGLAHAGVLDLNHATAIELEGLPGIGKKKAEAIVGFRTQHPFRRATEIMRVRGIGPKLYARLKEAICAGQSCGSAPVEVGRESH